jgi:E3 ubiquitin-protein transferase RMND5
MSIYRQSVRLNLQICIEYWLLYEAKISNSHWSKYRLLLWVDIPFILRVIVRWVDRNRDFLQSHSSSLEFYLHRSEYLRLLTPDPSEQSKAIQYATKHLQPFFSTHTAEFKRLMACLIFLPKERMQKSPYEDLTSDTIDLDLENMFATEFSASLGMSKQPPLKAVGDIGGGGALAKIEKGRKIMRERKSEWSQTDELPVRTPLC